MQAMSINAAEIPPITPGRVAAVATAELEASIALLGGLDDGDWARPTDCAGWTVHDLTAHLAGQYQGLARLGVYLRRHRRTTASRSTTSAATPGRSLSRCSPRSAPGRSAPAVGCPA